MPIFNMDTDSAKFRTAVWGRAKIGGASLQDTEASPGDGNMNTSTTAQPGTTVLDEQKVTVDHVDQSQSRSEVNGYSSSSWEQASSYNIKSDVEHELFCQALGENVTAEAWACALATHERTLEVQDSGAFLGAVQNLYQLNIKINEQSSGVLHAMHRILPENPITCDFEGNTLKVFWDAAATKWKVEWAYENFFDQLTEGSKYIVGLDVDETVTGYSTTNQYDKIIMRIDTNANIEDEDRTTVEDGWKDDDYGIKAIEGNNGIDGDWGFSWSGLLKIEARVSILHQFAVTP